MQVANVKRVLGIAFMLLACGVCLLTTAAPAPAPAPAQPASDARPIDLYDDVSDFFEVASLDDVPTSGRSSPPETFCRMPARKGVCRALIPRWSYDPVEKECVEFKFGGCDGNDNNFSSYKACMATCQGM